ncbi:uncharacterized protein LOC121008276 [Bufo bufo]|uniref:uncharacterized protein LOC121008276 n=1 Tax=Bufo bufo TaxID=8384 RepID=UPI001ABE2113|nr:uncharacterized protein LOC121008276 [Bufo bufo]
MHSDKMEGAMRQKLDQIKEIMVKTKGIPKEKKQGKMMSGHNVAIVSALEDKDVQWLLREIHSVHFQEQVRNVNLINIMEMKEKNWEKKFSEYTFCIYVSKEHEWTQGTAAFQRVKSLSQRGKKNLVVVVDEVSNEKQTLTLEHHRDIRNYTKGFFIFSKTEKESQYQRMVNSQQPAPDNDARGSHVVSPPKVVIGIKHKVGIFSRSADRDFSWLKSLLTSEVKDHVLSVQSYLISNNGYQQLSEDLSHCTFGILYHTKNNGRVNITDVTDSLYDEELQLLSKTLGKKNTIVIIDDLEDASDQQKRIILHTQPMIADCANDLVLISYEDKTDNMGQSAKSKILNHFFSTSDERLKHPPVNSGYEHAASTPSRSIIGIFSRSEEEDYSWLKRLLTSEELGHKTVQCCNLSGNDNEALLKVAFKLQLGILYHSVKKGKIRLTDVRDSLYHEELEKLSTRLGKRKMIVVIDDLDESGDKMKQKILKKQPSLGSLAGDIFLFTEAEKKEVDRQSQGKHGNKMSKSARDKISNIMRLVT